MVGTSPGHPRAHRPWLLAPLLLLAGAAAAQPRLLNGVLGGSVLLSPALFLNETFEKIEWSFLTGDGTFIRLLEVSRGHSKRPNPKDQFRDRLEMVNETTLSIRSLQRGDRGVYRAQLSIIPAVLKEQLFNLSIYEPVPQPRIHSQKLSLNSEWCNITLRCQVPNGSDAHTTWQSWGTPWGHLCEDERALCLAVPPGAFNSTYTCVAHNPIGKQNNSIHLDTLCQPWEAPRRLRWHHCLVPLALGAGALLGAFCLWRRKRRKKAAVPSPPGEAEMLEPLELPYTEIPRRPPLEEQEQERGDPLTIYSVVQTGAGSRAEVVA